MKLHPFTPQKYRRRVFSQLWMLALQFVLGMILNIIGRDTSGASHVFYIVILIAHIVNAIGLIEGGIFIALKAPGALAWWGAAMVILAAAMGTTFVVTDQDVWSFAMAMGFITSAWQYVTLYVRADRLVQAQKAR